MPEQPALNITVIGRGNVGESLATLWRSAGHEVTTTGHDGGHASGSDVVVVAIPADAIPEALANVSGLSGKTTIDASNLGGTRDAAYSSNAHQVQAIIGGPTAKAFNLNFASLHAEAAAQRVRPSSLFAADPEAVTAVTQLISDAGYEPVSVGDLSQAHLLEEHAQLAFAILQGGLGPYFSRVAAPGNL